MTKPKITVVGAGNVGATCALYLAQKELGDVCLVDVVEGVPQGKALDMAQAAPIQGYDVKITGHNDYEATAGSQIYVVTAGLARKPGQDRLDLLGKNASIIGSVVKEIKRVSPQAMILMVSNPIDVMVYLAYTESQFPAERVFGQAGVLDSARFACFIAERLKVSVKDISPMVLGGHGDTMVPLPRYTTVNGVPLTDLLPANEIEAMVKRTREGGAEIVNLLKTGSAYYAPAAATVSMVEAILKDQKRVLPASVLLKGQYGIKDLFVGVPVKFGSKGVEEIQELKLTDAELKLLQDSSKVYEKAIAELKQVVKPA
jgi:malate dehydrogenase